MSIAMWQYRGYTTILSLVLLQTPPPSVADALSVPLSERLSRCSRCIAAAILSEIEPATCCLRLRAQLRYHYTVTQRKKPAMFKWCSSGARGAYAFLFIRPCCTYYSATLYERVASMYTQRRRKRPGGHCWSKSLISSL